MAILRPFCRVICTLPMFLGFPGIGWADGFLLGKRGQYVPEKEQRAFIEWEAGRERLFVATRSGESTGPALWIVPVPATPEGVDAEPVERFPHVVTSRPVVQPARGPRRHHRLGGRPRRRVSARGDSYPARRHGRARPLPRSAAPSAATA